MESLFTWRIDEITWPLAISWLLGGTAVFLFVFRTQPRWRLAALVFLVAAGFVPLVAGSQASALTAWLVLMLVWGVAWTLSTPADDSVWPKLKWLLLSVPFIWLAAINQTNQPTMSQTAVLLAALPQLGVWPVHGWRQINTPATGFTALLQTAPVLAGAVWLARWLVPASSHNLLVTVVGLGSLLAGVYLVWRHLASPIVGVAVTQAGFILLAAQWATPSAVLAETRVLLLVVTILVLTANQPIGRGRWWRIVPPLVALAALAGLPLTAGFAGRAALYTAWLNNGNGLLLLVAALLHIPLITAVFLSIWQNETVTETADPMLEVATWLPVAGLFSFSLNSHLLAVVAILLPALLGVLIPWRWPNLTTLREAVAQAFPFLWVRQGWQLAQQLGRGAGAALREAALILEGEGGLLWLLLFIFIYWIIR